MQLLLLPLVCCRVCLVAAAVCEGAEAACMLLALVSLCAFGLLLALRSLVSLHALAVGCAVDVPRLVRQQTQTATATAGAHRTQSHAGRSQQTRSAAARAVRCAG